MGLELEHAVELAVNIKVTMANSVGPVYLANGKARISRPFASWVREVGQFTPGRGSTVDAHVLPMNVARVVSYNTSMCKAPISHDADTGFK